MNFILLTKEAENHLLKKLKTDDCLEISLEKYGCAGFKNVFNIKKISDIDKDDIKKIKNINIAIAKENLKYFADSVLDLKKEGMNYKLVIENPNVNIACGCGESINFKKGI